MGCQTHSFHNEPLSPDQDGQACRGCSDPVTWRPREEFQRRMRLTSRRFEKIGPQLWTVFCLLRPRDSTATAPPTPLLTPHADCLSQSNTALAYAAMQNLPADSHAVEIQRRSSVSALRWSAPRNVCMFFFFLIFMYYSFWLFVLGGPWTVGAGGSCRVFPRIVSRR